MDAAATTCRHGIRGSATDIALGYRANRAVVVTDHRYPRNMSQRV